jgi:hypothetical protein
MSNLLIPKGALTEETLLLAKGAFAKGPQAGPGIQKAGINIVEGLVGVNLEAPSKKLFPVYSPLRNRIPRIASSVGATAVQWKQIEKINSANVWPGVAENLRNVFNTTLTAVKTASFATIGHDDYVGFEALAASKGFEDVRATAALNLLYSVMISEEKVILGGQSTDIGPPGTVLATPSATGGALVAATYVVRVSALVLRGFVKAEKSTGSVLADGESTPSDLAGIVVPGTTVGSIALTWPAKKGAVAYNVFLSTAGGAAATATYSQTVTVNAALLTVVPAGAVVNATDETGNALEFDGIISQIETQATPATLFVDKANGTLTSDSSGGITEFDGVLKSMWDNYRLGPTCILVNSQQAADITKKIGGSSNLAYRIYLEDGQRNVVGGIYVGSYLNKFASSFAEGFPNEVPIKIHPDLPESTILFIVESLPYPNNQVPNVWEIETRQEYTQYEWALVQRRYEFGIYCQEVLKGYFSKAQGAIVGVKAG